MLVNKIAKTKILLMYALVCLSLSHSAWAQDYKWSQELGLYSLSTSVDSSEISGPGLPPATAIDIADGESFLLTTTYHKNDNLSFEFFYSWAKELDAQAAGSVSALGVIGDFEFIAPTLMANWSFGDSTWKVRPYLGVGINRMIYLNEEANSTLVGAFGGETSVEIEDTWGLAATAGLTWSFTDRLYATLSYVYIPTDPEVILATPSVGTVRTANLDIDLNISYLNFGYRF